MEPSHSSAAAACVVLTTAGKTIIKWERDGCGDPLPLHYPMLSMLLASLIQFSKGSDFGHLELQGGITAVVSIDAAMQVAVAVLFVAGQRISRAPIAGLSSFGSGSPLQLARLKSLVVLYEIVHTFRDDIERIAAENTADAEAMAEAYTLSLALDGFQSEDETRSEFLTFQHTFVTATMERTAHDAVSSLEWISSSTSPLVQPTLPVKLLQGIVLNAATGDIAYATPAPASDSEIPHRWLQMLSSSTFARLLEQSITALHDCFPLLYHTSLLKCSNTSRMGFGNADRARTFVLFLSLNSSIPESSATNSVPCVGLQMFPTGVFAAAVLFIGDHDLFKPQSSSDLQRILVVDPRGTKLLRLILGTKENQATCGYQLHVGSDDAPNSVLDALDSISQVWVKRTASPSVRAVGQAKTSLATGKSAQADKTSFPLETPTTSNRGNATLNELRSANTTSS